MKWDDVGVWLKKNAGSGASLVGSLITGNIPGAVAAGISLVGSATGTNIPEQALEALQDPATMLRLKELATKNDESIRQHIQAMEEMRLKDEQAEHAEQQQTIRSGDNSQDEYVRHTRPMMARQSWYATMLYIIGFECMHAFGLITIGAQMELAMLILAPAGAYLGFRSLDKFKRRT